MEITLENLPRIENYSDSDYEVAMDMLESLWYNYSVNKGTTSLPYWMNKFSTHNEATKMIMALAKLEMVKTIVPSTNYATIELDDTFLRKEYSVEELVEIKQESRLAKYAPLMNKPQEIDNNTKIHSGLKDTGIKRPGLAKASTHPYQYDIPMMKKYFDEIVVFSVKAMKKLEQKLEKSLVTKDEIDYESTIKHTLNYIIENPNEYYYLGKLTNDSRGRAIYQCLKTIFNPIANKMARALVKTPANKATPEDIEHVYLFVEELVSGFDGDVGIKRDNGRISHILHATHDDVDNDDLFENIWLERLYADLDAYEANPDHEFTTPIEIDFSASNMCIIGLLLNHSDYIDHTQYMWEIPGLSKLHVKTAQTPYVFGSNASISSLWKGKNLKYTTEQIITMKNEQVHGKYSIANELKNIIIQHSHPTEEMYININNEIALVECNKHKWVSGDKDGSTLPQNYIVYDSVEDQLKIITNKISHQVADLDRFRVYLVTGLIHRVDSQIMDKMCLPMEWVIPIHDAGLTMVSEARKFKNLAVEQMMYYNANRVRIMEEFFKTINLDEEGWYRYAKLLAKVQKLNPTGEVNITPWLLK